MSDIQTTAELIEGEVLAKAFHEDGADLVENHAKPPQGRKSPAEWAYERVILYIRKFEEGLDTEHEVAMGFAGSDMGSLHIQGMGFYAPDMVTFYGVSESGERRQLLQHVSQLNVMLRAAPKMQPKARRIGFALSGGLAEDSATS